MLIKTQEQPTKEMEAILKTTDSVAGSHMKQFLKHYHNLSFFIAFTNCIFFAIIYLHARQRGQFSEIITIRSHSSLSQRTRQKRDKVIINVNSMTSCATSFLLRVTNVHIWKGFLLIKV